MLHPKYLLVTCFAAIVLVAILLSPPAYCASDLTFTSSGQIVGPGGRVSLDGDGTVAVATAGGDTFTLSIPSNVQGGKEHWSGSDFTDKKLVIDAADQKTTFSATITDPALPAPIPVSYSIMLTPEGKARITLQYGCVQPVTKFLSLGAIFFYTPRAPMLGTTVTVNGVSSPIANTPPSDKATMLSTDNEGVRTVAFCSDNAYRTVTADIVTASSESVSDENLVYRQSIGLRVQPLNNVAVIDVSLPEKVKPLSAETYGGNDYYAAEHIHLPQYNLSRNLVQNPSFEEGLQYWTFGSWGRLFTDHILPDYYLLDRTQAHSGSQCAMILGQAGQQPVPLSTFAIPLALGKQYTLSFYAKADRPGLNLASGVIPFGSGRTDALQWETPVTQTWQRYSYTFAAPGAVTTVQFNIKMPSEDCGIYLDDVQLEAGTLTDFTRKPLELALLTDHRNNLFAPGAPVRARWQLSGVPGSSGRVAVTLRDFMGNVLQQHTAAFKLGADGTASVPEPWLEHQGRGMYFAEAEASTASGFREHEYGRLSIAGPADPTVKHHNLFAMGGSLPDDPGSWARMTGYWQYFGIGSIVSFDPPQNAHLAIYDKDHIIDVSAILDGGEKVGQINIKYGWTGPDSDLKILEQAAYTRALAYPSIMYWKLLNEPQGQLNTDPVLMKRLIVALTAVRQGILRANPRAHIISLDPSSMDTGGGIAMMDNFLSNGGAAICDIAGIHPYRSRPEDPDMDVDTAAYLKMLDRHNFKGPVWFTEGGGYLGVHNPALGVDVHVALSNEFFPNAAWWSGSSKLSYDVGDGERYAAAYSVRSWLVGLKYSNRVKQQVEWYFGPGVIDYDGTPETRAMALNALVDILGNADYVKDIPLSADVRCYMFRDPQNRPVAVVWSHDLLHETQTLPPSTLHLGALAPSLQMFAMDGSPVTADKTGTLAVSPFPIYLRGAPGTAAKLAAAIANGFVSTDAGSVVGYAQVRDKGHAGIALRSTLAKPVAGTLSITTTHHAVKIVPVSLTTGKTTETLVPFTTRAGGINSEDAVLRWNPSGSQGSLSFPLHIDSLLCPTVHSPLPMDGNLTSWASAGANVFPIPQHMMSYHAFPADPKYPGFIPWAGPEDLSGTFAIAYAPGTLYLAFDITDNKLVPAATVENTWQGDGIQLYFDPWLVGHSLSKTGFFYDDEQELYIWPNAPNATVYRAHKPYDQVAFTKIGVVSSIKSSLTIRPGGYVVQLAIPESELAPLSLKPGGVFNFAFIVDDNDGEFRKRGLTLTPDGTEPYQHQELWPSVVLDTSP